MKVTKIYFQKSFNVAEFLYEHYGAEVLIEEGETAEEGFEKAKQTVWHQLENNHPVYKEAERQLSGEMPVIDYGKM